MKLRHYPSTMHIMNLHRRMNGNQTGLAMSNLVFQSSPENAQTLRSVSLRIPDYHKILWGEDAEIEPHLVGYGLYQEEALIRLLGETAERYALLSSSLSGSDQMIKASFNELAGTENVLPWELINIFSKADYEKLAQEGAGYQALTKDDKISWLWCPSLFDPEEKICIPAQFLHPGLVFEVEEKRFITSLSKGTAAHRTTKQALKAAIVEVMEADAFMLRWYTDLSTRKINVDDELLLELLSEVKGGLDCEVLLEDLSMPEFPVHVVNSVLQNTRGGAPTILNGLGAGLEPKSVVYRTFAESLAIYPLGRYGALFSPKNALQSKGREFGVHTNLDSNVIEWADPENAREKLAFMQGRHSEEIGVSQLKDYSSGDDDELTLLLDSLRKISKFAVTLDVTPPDLVAMGWRVVRVFVPELVQFSLPSFPYSQHPRMLQYGGVTNEVPHAIP